MRAEEKGKGYRGQNKRSDNARKGNMLKYKKIHHHLLPTKKFSFLPSVANIVQNAKD